MMWSPISSHSSRCCSCGSLCLNVAAGYGVCMPCSNPLKACGQTTGGGTGSCDHKVCEKGGPLKESCDSCASEVCKHDSYCCTTGYLEPAGEYRALLDAEDHLRDTLWSDRRWRRWRMDAGKLQEAPREKGPR